MKFAGNGRLNRRELNWMYGKKIGRPDEECWRMDAFLVNTMSGCSWDLKYFGDLLVFMKEYGVTPAHFRSWFALHNEDDPTWVVVEKQNEKVVWTWFKHSRQMGPWVAIGEDCPVTHKLVPCEGGGYTKELIEV